MKRHLLMALATVMVLVFFTIWAGGALAQEKAITIGGKNFTEQYLLVELAKRLLEKEGFKVTARTGVGTAIARQSLEADQIDMYYEYTGTAYTVFYQEEDPAVMTDPVKVYDWVRRRDAQKGLVWLEAVRFNNTYTIMMRREDAAKMGIKTISDFGNYVDQNPKEVTFALEAEFWERPDGFRALMALYQFRMPVRGVKRMDMGLTYLALRNGQVTAATGFATDGRISGFDLVNLEDDKNFFPVYNPAPVIRKAVLDQYPEIREVLKPLAEKLDTDTMQRLNAEVDVEHKDVSRAVEEWLKEVGLL
ncbi:glycine betaine ABC transporter substrate-binding protein [Desulfatitalea alkaliphila]|uniref:Glycine/betaine ABC transporter substrate-binding protein n=1 Tax=Desulfatitalea alkaliphila TaxID=2929485 RepID=A0AA41R0I7_9BACT|nr:glycine betaine ABC transporter substrate-binding protein [Desulfatitalea alkaliphila]MCJ8499674.1 glycine/betaine ABC transporter substrate-binding protein [Desulfatitalea alkaliphila]